MGVRVGVIGAGSWGTTVAHLCAHKASTLLYARDRSIAEAVNANHENPRYLPGIALHPRLRATADLAEAADSDVLVMAVPSHGFRAVLQQLRPHLRGAAPVVSLTKGLEHGTHLRMTEVVNDELDDHPVGVLTGPNLASEIIAGQAAAAVLAMTEPELAEQLQGLFSAAAFRVYTNGDVIGSEMAGAVKNVIALAAGMADGLKVGDNARAAVITRGLAELTRLGTACGGNPQTFAGLAGLGDLLATCSSSRSRNRYVGEQLGRGRSASEIMAAMDQVAEGVGTAPVVVALAEKLGVDTPIASEVRAVIADERSAVEAYRRLLERPATTEIR